MIEFLTEHAGTFRLPNLVLGLLVIVTLGWRHLYNHPRRDLDDRLRSATSVLPYVVLVVASGIAYSRGYVAPSYVAWMTFALLAYLVALWTPWRWRLPART